MKLSLRWKIVGGFGLLLTLIVLLGWVTLSLFGSLRSVQQRVFREAIPGLVVVDELVRSYTAQSAAVYAYLIRGQGLLVEQYRDEVAEATVWERRAQDLFRARGEHELLVQMVAAGSSFQQLVDEKVVPLVAKGNRSQAFRVMGEEASPLIAEIEAVGELLRQAQDHTVARTETDLDGASNRVLATLLLVTIGALLIGVTLAIDLPRRLVADLSNLVSAARAIGRGDFDQRISIRSGDEVEELAERFGEMQSGLKRLQQLALQDRELEIAASIQKNLLQRTFPETDAVHLAPLQRQANLVGGDWYDVSLEGMTMTVVIGDASGKGIGAALMATVALSVLRAERRMGAGPARVIARTNEALREATDPDSFTTLLYVTIDLRTGEVRWLNMGHPAPFILRSWTGERPARRGYFLEGPRNRALGWFEDPGLSESVIRLEPGDRLVLFTDGFLEAKTPDGEVFGDHRLAQALIGLAELGSDDLGNRLMEEVERYAAGKLDDDLTMLIAEYRGAPLEASEDGTGEEQWRSRR
ncbi:MAG: PP2C family protein-serine/threonine phosphatase [Actinomycetota bacterium]